MKRILNVLLVVVLLLTTFKGLAQAPAAPGNGIYGLIHATYQVAPTATGFTTANLTLQNTTLTKYAATQFRVFYDKIAFTNATVALIGSTTNLDLQYTTNTINGYITITLVYTGANATYTLANGERFAVTFTHAAAAVFNNLASISNLTWTGTQTYQQYAGKANGMDTTLTLHNYGGVFTLPTFTYAGNFTNTTGTSAKQLPLALQRRPAGGSTWTQHSAYVTDNSGNFTFTVNLDTTYWDVRLAIQGDTMAVNGSNNVTITDAYGVFGKVAGNFATWPNNVKNVKFFTATEYATINNSATNYTSTIAGATNFTFEIIAGQPSTVTYYVCVPGDANGTGYHMARETPIEIVVGPAPGLQNQIYNVIDTRVEYDFPTTEIEVNVPNVSVDAGNLVNLPVKVLTNGVELNSLQFGLEYDPTVLEFKSLYSTSAANKWMTFVNPTLGGIAWGGYDVTNNVNPLRDGDDVVTIQFLALQPQAEWTESPLWTTRKYAGNTSSKDLEITPTNGILQVLKMQGPGIILDDNNIQIYPNPFREEVSITFNIATQSDAQLAVYDLQGRKVVTLMSGQLPAGQYSYVKNLGKLAAGMYMVSLSSDTEAPIVQKLVKQD